MNDYGAFDKEHDTVASLMNECGTVQFRYSGKDKWPNVFVRFVPSDKPSGIKFVEVSIPSDEAYVQSDGDRTWMETETIWRNFDIGVEEQYMTREQGRSIWQNLVSNGWSSR